MNTLLWNYHMHVDNCQMAHYLTKGIDKVIRSDIIMRFV